MDPRTTYLLLFGLLPTLVNAQQYRWADENGRVHYTGTPPPASAKSVERKDLRGNTMGAQPDFELMQAMKKAPVKLYSHPECKDLCQTARDVLNRRGIPFEEVSAADSIKLDELRRISGAQGVPVLVVGSYVENRPLAKAYDEALDSAGYPPVGRLKPRDQHAPAPSPATSPGAGEPSQDTAVEPSPSDR